MNSLPEIRLDGLEPKEASRPESAREIGEVLREAGAGGRTVLPCGQRTRMNAGGIVNCLDHVLLTSALTRLIHYEPDDLTVTVEAGCGLRELGDALRERRQFLPVQDRSARGTIGGLLATADEGGTALRYGGVRDYVTGLSAVLGNGSIVKAGGRVVKNVAGYGIHRLMVGSRGTLGVIVEVSLRVQPLPEAEGTILAAFGSREDAFRAARAVIASGIEPLFANVLDDGRGLRLAVGFDGTERRVAAHLEQVRSLVAPFRPEGYSVLTGDEQIGLRRILDDPALATTERSDGGTRMVVRMTARPAELEDAVGFTLAAAREAGAVARLDARPGCGSAFVTIETQDSGVARAALEATLAAARTRGHAVVIDAPIELRRDVDAWGPRPGEFAIMRKIRTALDPAGVLARGRFVGGL